MGGEDWWSEPGGGGAGQKPFASGDKRDTSLLVLLPHPSGAGVTQAFRKAERRSAPIVPQSYPRLSTIS